MTQRDEYSSWPAFIKRVRGLAESKLKNNTDGIAVVCVDMVVNNLGEPRIWLEPSIRRVEPSADAARVFLQHFTEHSRKE